MIQDRRQYPRLIPDSALLVSLDKSRRGFLFDLSEGGVAFDGLVPATAGPSVISLAFDLPEGGGSIEAVGEVVWSCDSRHRTGVKFLELAEESRRQLKDWLSTRVVAIDGETEQGPDHWGSASGVTNAARQWILQEISSTDSEPPIAEDTPKRHGGFGDITKRHRSLSAVAGLMGLAIIATVFVAVGYYVPGRMPAAKTASVTGTLKTGVALSPVTSAARVSELYHALPGVTKNLPAQLEGFVLQVGAMAYKQNAESLVEKLQGQSFPAFIFDQAADGLYRVDVGPYSDPDYAHSVRDELRSAGFKTILERQLAQ